MDFTHFWGSLGDVGSPLKWQSCSETSWISFWQLNPSSAGWKPSSRGLEVTPAETVVGRLRRTETTVFCTSPGTCLRWDSGGPRGCRWWCRTADPLCRLPSATCGCLQPCWRSRSPWPRRPARSESVCADQCWPVGGTERQVDSVNHLQIRVPPDRQKPLWSVFSAHLMSSCQRRVSVHVVFWLADVDHLVGVELEHALDLQLAVVFQRLVRGDPGHLLLLQLLPSPLALPYPPQVPEGGSRRATISDADGPPSQTSDYSTQQGVRQVYRESSHKFYKKKNRECVCLPWLATLVKQRC